MHDARPDFFVQQTLPQPIPAWITPALISETLDLLRPFLEKELTSGDVLPLLLNVQMPPLTDRKTGKKGIGRTGKKAVTNTALAALKTVGIPAVRMHASGQYYARIGYRRSASGVRQRSFFYLGKDENAAIAKAAVIKQVWKKLKKKQGRNAVWESNPNAVLISLRHLTSEQVEARIAEFHQNLMETGVEDVGMAQPRYRVDQVKEMYLEYRKGKVGIVGGQGINESTYSNESRNLKGGLKSVAAGTLIDSLDYAALEKLRDNIFRRVGGNSNGISKRTANSYWLEVHRMLNWAHHQSYISYRHPEGAEELFSRRFRNPNPIRIARYDPTQLKKLVDHATDRQRLYIYLALNCGYYPSDIGTIRRREIVVRKDDTAIIRQRSKTVHQNDFEAMHVLWPETAALLKREMAKCAQFGDKDDDLALLTIRGTPLYRRSPKCDNIGDSYLALHRAAGVDLPFKQFRKIGATAMQRIGGDEIRRLYKAGTIDDGDKVYVLETWDKLTPHLSAWGEELRRDEILYDMPT